MKQLKSFCYPRKRFLIIIKFLFSSLKKVPLTTFLIFNFFILFHVNAQSLKITGFSGNRCNGNNFILNFSYDTLNIPVTPILAQLSDVNGLFGTPYALGNTSTITNGNGSISCLFTGIAAGTNYRIRIRSSDATPKSDTSGSFTISIPSASFTFSPNNVCSGTPISFSNASNSLAGIASYFWTFTGGTGTPPNTTSANPTVTFNPGVGNGISNYTIGLNIVDNNGCATSTTQSNVLQVKPLPDPTIVNLSPSPFIKCDDSLRVNLSIDNFSTTFTTNSSYSINYGNSIIRNFDSTFVFDTITYVGFGYFQLRNLVTNRFGCSKDTFISVFNGKIPSGSIVNPGLPVSSCIPFTFYIPFANNVFQNPPGTFYTLSFSNGRPDTTLFHPPPDSIRHTINSNSCGFLGSNGSTTFNNAFQVNLLATNPCGTNGSVIVPIRTRSKPKAIILGDSSFCINATRQFTDASINGFYPSGSPIGNSCDSQTYRRWFITPTSYSIISGSLGTNFTPLLQGSNIINIRFNSIGTYTLMLVKQSLSGCGNDTAIKTICVQPIPTPNFTFNISPANRCLPVTVNTTNTSNTLASCGTTSYTWSTIPAAGVTFAGGTNANSINAQMVFNQSGVFTLRLAVANQCTTVVKDTIIIIKGPPNATLLNNQTYCGPQTISFNNNAGLHRVVFDTAFGQTISYNWSVQPTATFTGGTNSFSKYPTIFFDQSNVPITYRVIAQITNECGTGRDTQEITILPKPGLPVNVGDTFRCGPGAITLTGSPGTYGSNLNWYSINGTLLQTGLNYTPSLTGTTNYYVRSVIGSTGCLSDSLPITVTVYPIPSVAINGINATRCGPGIITLSSTVGINANTIRWYDALSGGNLIDTGISITRFVGSTTIFYASSFNNLSGCESNGARLPVTATVNIIPTVNAGTKNQSYCYQNLPVTLSGYSPPISGSGGTGVWSSIPSGKVNANGTFNPISSGLGIFSFIYTFTASNGCLNHDTISVSIVNAAFANAGNDTTVCKLNKTIQFSGQPIGGVWSGQKINSSGVFSSDSAGIFKIYYSFGSGSCLTIDSALVNVIASPIPSFVVSDSLCNYQTFNLNASATSTFGSNSFTWTVSNNSGFSNSVLNNNNIANPVVVYPENKTSTNVNYTFKLIVTNGLGCKDSLTRSSTLLRRPTAQFTLPSPFCGPVVLNTNNTSSGSPNVFNWTVNPNSSVIINTPTLSNTQITLPINFTASLAQYQVQLVTGIQHGSKVCYDTTQNQVIINQKPSVNFNISAINGCSPLSVNFTNISDPRNGAGLSTMNFQWFVNNNLVASSQNHASIFANPIFRDSVYQIKLKGANSLGCLDSVVKTVTVYPEPKALFSASFNSSCPPFVISPTLISLTQFPLANNQYIWQFLNPNKTIRKQQIGISPPTDTISTGLDSIYLRLITTSPNNCNADTLELVFRTIANPVAGFNMSDSLGCHPLSVQFTNTSTPGVSLLWRLGNGSTSTAANPLISYPNLSHTLDSIYRIKLVITAGGTGCKDSIEKLVRVLPKPLARFTLATNVCANSTINPSNTSLFKGSANANTYRWAKFNASVSLNDSTIASPIIAFAQNQTSFDSLFNIRLRITSADGCVHDTTRPINQRAVPLAQFSLNNKGCGPITLQATNGTTNVQINSLWSVTPATGVNISTSASTSPNISFPINLSNDSINYNIRLIATRSTILNCPDSAFRIVTIYPKPNINFNVSDTAKCNPALFTFTNTSNPKNGDSINSMLFNWNFGNGILSNALDSQMSYLNNGITDIVYNVKLKGVTKHGCLDSITKTVRIWPDAEAVFTANITTSCAPFAINSSVISTQIHPQANGIYRWFANNVLIGTGAAFPGQTLQNPSDSVTIKLVVTSLNGCKDDSMQMVFRTIANPVAGFNMSDSLGCHPLSVQFTNTSTPGVSLLWRLGNGSTSTTANPLINYPNLSHTIDSVYRIRLIITAGGTGCKDSIEKLVRVLPKPLARFTLTTNVCANSTINPSNTSVFKGAANISTYRWTKFNASLSLSDSTIASPTIAFAQNQTSVDSLFNIRLRITSADGCVHDTTRPINQRAVPLAQFSLNNKGCGPITLQATNGTTNVQINSLWSVTPATGLNIVTTTSTSPNISFPLNNTNDSIIYNVRLVATRSNLLDCRDTALSNVVVYPKPNVNFNASDTALCSPALFTFTNQSSPKNGEPINSMLFNWNFGNGILSNAIDTQMRYLNNGTTDIVYNVKLKGTSKHGCLDSTTKTVRIWPDAKASFTANNTTSCAPFAINSSVISTQIHPQANGIYHWFANNVLIGTGAAFPGHTLPNPSDSVTIKLVVTSLNGCKDDSMQLVFRTIANPVAGFNMSDSVGCHPLSVQFTNTSTSGVSLLWRLGNGNTSTTANPLINYPNLSHTIDSVYRIRLIITAGGTGCKDSIERQVRVFPRPLASFTLLNQICAASSVLPTNASVFKGAANVSTYRWTKFNASVSLNDSTIASPTIAFAQNQTAVDSLFNIRLRITSADGCVHDTTRLINQRAVPLAQFSLNNKGCGPITLQATNGTTNVQINSLWSVTPATGVSIVTTSSSSPNISFPLNNTNDSIIYNVRLVATRSNLLDCRDTALNNVVIYPKPNVNFNVSDIALCSPALFTFTNTSNPKNGDSINSMSFNWNFGNGVLSNAIDTQMRYLNNGNNDIVFNVKLKGTTKHGCLDSTNKTVRIWPDAKAVFTASTSTSCAPFFINSSVISTQTHPQANGIYRWFANNVLIGTGATFPGQTLQNPADSVTIKLVVTSLNGCKDDSMQMVFRTIANPVADFNMSDSAGCHPLSVQFTNTSTSGVSLLWRLGNGNTSTNANPLISYPNLSHTIDSVYRIKLVVTAGGTGCKDSIERQVRVFPRPLASFTLLNQICAASSVLPTNTSVFKGAAAANSYSWTKFNASLSLSDSTIASPTIAFAQNQTSVDSLFNIRLRITSVDGCVHDTTRPINQRAVPLAQFSLTNKGCGPITLQAINNTTNIPTNALWSVNPISGVNIVTTTSTSPNISFPLNNTNDSIIYNVRLVATRSNLLDCRDTSLSNVVIFPKPNVNFNVSDTALCSPALFTFTNTSNPKNGDSINSMSFNWNFGNSVLSNAIDTQMRYLNNGNNDIVFNVKLKGTTKHGCLDSITKTVRIWPDAKAVFTRTTVINCAPFIINASNVVASTFPDANSNYEWYANQNLIGTGLNFPGFILSNQADSVKITLKAISKNGCKNDSMEAWFYTIENPKPKFIAVDSITCSGNLVQFNNLSTPNFGLSYQWFFGNQTLGSTQNNPSLIFNNYGVLDTTILIKLITIAGGTGCRDSIIKPIVIKPLPNPNFNFSDSINCFPRTVLATINSTNIPPINALTYHWQGGPTGIFISNDSAATSTSLSFNDNQSGTNNIYWLRLKVQSDFGCLDSVQKQVRIPTRPIANFNFVLDSGCGPYNTIASSISSFANNFQWLSLQVAGNIVNPTGSNINIQFPGHRGSIDSIYKIRLIASSIEGCIDSIEKPVSVFPKPIASFSSSVDSGCAPLPVKFISNSDVKKPALFNWQFGDGNGIIGTSDSSNHLFLGSIFNDTIFFTRLIIRSANGCLDTVSKAMYIESGAVAKIHLPDTQLCSSKTSPASLRIENKSYGSVDTFYWNFGDGQELTTTADSTILHPYDKEGYYRISLKAVNDCRESFDTAYVLVQTPPNLLITKTDSVGCSPMNVQFSNLSTDTFRAVFNWNMGNGNSYTSFQVPTQTYLQSLRNDTFYYVNHNISNVCGNFINRDTIQVLPKPTSFFLTNTDSGCSPLPVFMQNQSFGVPQQFLWHFGNGDSSIRQFPLQNPITYTTIDTPSTFSIRLIVSNICGSDTSYRKVKVMPNTVKSFFTADIQNGCDALTVQFTDYAMGGQNISWNFGDGSGSSLKNPKHTFSNPGTYRVFQYVNNNCSFDTSSLLINVFPSPAFSLEKLSTPVCERSPVFFKANIIDSGTLTWHFGDGDSSQLINPVHYYKTSGLKVFRAILVSNTNYCSRTLTDSIFINALPEVKITADTIRACQNLAFRFVGSTLQPSFLIWDFGDSTYGLGYGATHFFSKPGNYRVKVIATNAAGCSDTAINDIIVYPVPVASFGLNPKDTCNGPAWVNFTNTSVGANTYQWTFGNGNNSSNVNERQFFSGIGKYNNQLIATNNFLCKDTSEAIFEIFEKPVPEFTFTPTSLCVGATVSFTNTSKLGASYVWYFGDGDSSTLENPSHVYKDSGQYKVTLFVYAGTICFDSLSSNQIITVHPNPNPSFLNTVDISKKPSREVVFEYTGTNGYNFNWQFGDGSIGQGRKPMHVYGESDSGCFGIKLDVESFYGCDTTISDTICLPGYWKGLYVPNAFTPNYGIDAVRTFLPSGKELRDYHLRIYTKWGELVWESTELRNGSPAIGWDGKHKDTGNECDQGAYIWTIEATFTDGKAWDGMLFPGATKVVRYGNVTLIR